MDRCKAILSAISGSLTAIAVVSVFSILSGVVAHIRDESFNGKMTGVRIATGVEYGSTAIMLTMASLAIAVIVSLVTRRKLIVP